MKTRICYKVFVVVLLSALALADKEEGDNEPQEIQSREDEDIEAQDSKQPVHKLQAASGFLAPVSVGYNGHQEVYPPKPYKFGYEIKDPHHGKNFRHEESDGYGNKRGSYGYRDPTGLYRIVDYVADKHGFRAAIRTNEPGTANQNPAHVNILSLYKPIIGGPQPQQVRALIPQPQIKYEEAQPQIHIQVPPPSQHVQYVQHVVHEQPKQIYHPPPQIRFVPRPPPQQQFIARPPPTQIMRHVFAGPPAHLIQSRPQVQIRGPIVQAIRPIYNGASQGHVQIRGFASTPVGFRPQGPFVKPVGGPALAPIVGGQRIYHGPPPHLRGLIANQGRILNQGPHLGPQQLQGPFVGPGQVKAGQPLRQIQLRVVPVPIQIGGGRGPIIAGPQAGHGQQGAAGGIVNGVRVGIANGGAVQGQIRGPISGFRHGFRTALNQRLKGAHSGENEEGKQVVLPTGETTQAVFVGPFAQNPPDRQISHIVVSKVSELDNRQPVDVPGGDPAFIGPGPAPKFDPEDLKKKPVKRGRKKAQPVNG